MQCQTCGAQIQKPDQRYCHECGASLPQQSMLPTTKVHDPTRQQQLPARTRAMPPVTQTRPAVHEILAGVLPNTLQNRIIVGGITAVVAVVALKMLLDWIVSTLIPFVLIGAVVAAIIYVGVRYLMRARPTA
jgi:hypothetical protein